MTALHPRVIGPWSSTIADLGLVRQPRATSLMRGAIGHLPFDLPRPTGIPINLVGGNTKRYRLAVKWAGGNQLNGRPFPIPSKPLLEDANSKDFHLICWDQQTGELFECIAYQPKLGDGLVWKLVGRDQHRAAKAAFYSERSPWQPLEYSEQSACVAGEPIAPQLLHPDQLDHGLAICVPQRFIASHLLGLAAITGGASDADGWVTDPAAPKVRIGQELRLSDIDKSGWGSVARSIAHCMQVYGLRVIMSGNPDVKYLKFVVQQGAFAGVSKAKLAGLETITGSHLECWGNPE